MDTIFDLLSYAAICPVAAVYIFLLNDRWRVAWWGKGLLLAWCTAAPLVFVPFVVDFHMLLLLTWVLVIPPLWWASRVRDGRMLFLVLSAIFLTYITNTVANKLALHWVAPALLFRVVFDGCLLFVCAVFYRPVFLDILHVVHRGWGRLCLMPMTLWCIYLALTCSPDYFHHRELPQVQCFVVALLLIAILLYAVTFSFFKKVCDWLEERVDTALLDAQLDDLERRLQRQQTVAENARILRHDLRHYLPLFSQRLEAGDAQGARDVLDAMRTLTVQGRQEGGVPS